MNKLKNPCARFGVGAFFLALGLMLGGSGKSHAGVSGRDNSAELGVSNRLAAIAAAGDPVTLEDLSQLYAAPPAPQNAAPLYDTAFGALKNTDVSSPTFVADNVQALPLLTQAAERTACRYPVVLTDGAAAKLPHLAKIKTAATLLKMLAINQAAKGHPEAAATTLRTGISLARSLENEPLPISKLVQLASFKLIVDGLEQALNSRPFPEASLASLQAALKAAENGLTFRRVMVGERAEIIAHFQTSDAELAKAMATDQPPGASPLPDLVAYHKTEKFQRDFAFALDYMSNLVAVAEMPYAQAVKTVAPGADPQIEAAKSEGFLFSTMLLPALNAMPNKAAAACARARLAQIVLAIERHRLKHASSLPGGLTELVPEFLDAVPADPFTGEPLQYEPLTGKGYVVSSVGGKKTATGAGENSPDAKAQVDLSLTIRR